MDRPKQGTKNRVVNANELNATQRHTPDVDVGRRAQRFEPLAALALALARQEELKHKNNNTNTPSPQNKTTPRRYLSFDRRRRDRDDVFATFDAAAVHQRNLGILQRNGADRFGIALAGKVE